MLKIKKYGKSGQRIIETSLTGHSLINNAYLNKGTAFNAGERRLFGLDGLLPTHVSTIEQQLARVYGHYETKHSDIGRHIYLSGLHDRNEVLFYRLLLAHLEEMIPIIYTPEVGDICMHYSHAYRRARGLFIPFSMRNDIDRILDNYPYPDVEMLVVTDGERVLGLGDQGLGGIGISVGKLILYTLFGGIDPSSAMPVVLDAGTNNEELLADRLYLGWRHRRVTGKRYDDFIDAFARAVKKKFPRAVLQWEDFGRQNARRLMEKYRKTLCSFNDDIQGTAAVTLAALIAAVKTSGSALKDQRVVILGAGSAGTGIAYILLKALLQEGLGEEEARSRLWLVDVNGLVHSGMKNLEPAQKDLARPFEEISGRLSPRAGKISFSETVKMVRPTILIGASAQANAFTEPLVREMAAHAPRPVIFPLSNPTSKCEAAPADLLAWTGGRAIIATGTQFQPVDFRGKKRRISQCNNVFIYPGMGLGLVAAKIPEVTDDMFVAAARELSRHSPMLKDPEGLIFPPPEKLREISPKIALAVALQAMREGIIGERDEKELFREIQEKMWRPEYPRLVRA